MAAGFVLGVLFTTGAATAIIAALSWEAVHAQVTNEDEAR